MTNDIIQRIKAKQCNQPTLDLNPPRHKPEMLYIGCIDARLDPIDDIGIPKGKALIYRNVAALVRPAQGGGIDSDAAIMSGEIPESVSIGAALEFFVNHIDAPASGKKHIVVSGHTDCGGIRACLEDARKGDDYLPRYLTALASVRERVLADRSLTTEDQKCDALEEAAVRQSIENLMSYEVVSKAVVAGRLELHGWIINTATQKILEMDGQGIFQPIS